MKYLKFILILIVLSNIKGLKSQQVTVSGTSLSSTVTLVGTRTVVNITAGSAITVSRRSNADTLKNIMYTVVGGGGGGAFGVVGGGGGGGVAFNHTTGTHFVGNPTSISVGTGGTAGTNLSAPGGNGNSSTITLASSVQATGGSGGSSTSPSSPSPGGGNSGTPTQSGTANIGGLNVKSGNGFGGGGGGGAGTSNGVDGTAASASGGTGTGGAGAAGRQITNLLLGSGNNITYGGGGGGSATTTPGNGGAGGGGNASNTASAAGAGSPNTGGGGGSGTTSAGAGGSGVVVLSFDAWDIYDDVQASNKWIYANGTTRTAGLPIKIFPDGTNTITVTSALVSDVNADVYIEGAAVNIASGGSIVCKNLYITKGGSITTSSTGSLTCTTVFYTGNATVPSTGFNVTNLQILGANVTATLVGNITLTGTLTLSTTTTLLILPSASNSTFAVSRFAGPGHIRGNANVGLIYTGSTPSFLYMDSLSSSADNKRLKYLRLASAAQLSLGNKLVIYGNSGNAGGDLELNSGSILNSNSETSNASASAFLDFRYDATTTPTPAVPQAVIGGLSIVSPNTTPTINGEVSYEDCMFSGFRGAYRQVGHVIDSALSLNQFTDDFDLFADITSGSGGRGANIDGLLASITTGSATALKSAFTYDESLYNSSTQKGRWNPFLIKGTGFLDRNALPIGRGMHFIMRPTGSGASGNYNSQLFEYEGPLVNRDLSLNLTYSTNLGVTTSAGGYNLLANPYLSHLNLANFFTGNNNVDPAFYKYDKQAKNYDTYAFASGSWNKSKGGAGSSSGYNALVDPGEAFWVKLNSTTNTVTFSRSMTTVSVTGNKPDKSQKLEIDTASYSALRINLQLDTDTFLADGIVLISEPNGGDLKRNGSLGDIFDMVGNCNDISILASEKEQLSFKHLNANANYQIPLKLSVCNPGKFSLTFSLNSNKMENGIIYEIVDKFLNTSREIENDNVLRFEVTSDPNSFGDGRFFINAKTNSLKNDKLLNNQVVQISPNPCLRNEILKIDANSKFILTADLVNLSGQSILSTSILPTLGYGELDLNKAEIVPGIYFLKVNGPNFIAHRKIVIQ